MTAAMITDSANKSNLLATTREICDVFGRRNSKGLITVELEPGSDLALHETGDIKHGMLLSRRIGQHGKIELRIIAPNNSYLVINKYNNYPSDNFKTPISAKAIYHVLNGGISLINIQERDIKAKYVTNFDQDSVSISSKAGNKVIDHLIGGDNLVTLKKHIGNINIVIRDMFSHRSMNNIQHTAFYEFKEMGSAVALMAGEQSKILKLANQTQKGTYPYGDKTYITVTDTQIVIVCKDPAKFRDKLLAIASDDFLIRENMDDRNNNHRFAIYPKLTVQQVKIIQNQ